MITIFGLSMVGILAGRVAIKGIVAACLGLLVGTSSGANVWAARQLAASLPEGSVIATVLPDRAERYFSTALI